MRIRPDRQFSSLHRESWHQLQLQAGKVRAPLGSPPVWNPPPVDQPLRCPVHVEHRKHCAISRAQPWQPDIQNSVAAAGRSPLANRPALRRRRASHAHLRRSITMAKPTIHYFPIRGAYILSVGEAEQLLSAPLDRPSPGRSPPHALLPQAARSRFASRCPLWAWTLRRRRCVGGCRTPATVMCPHAHAAPPTDVPTHPPSCTTPLPPLRTHAGGL